MGFRTVVGFNSSLLIIRCSEVRLMPRKSATASAVISSSSSINFLSRPIWSKGIVAYRYIAKQVPIWYNGIKELRNRLAEMRFILLEETSYVYAMCDQDDGSFLYVGQSLYPCSRYNSHINAAKLHDPSKGWLLERIINGKDPLRFIIEASPLSQVSSREKYWIEKITKAGYQLHNLTFGGEGPGIRTHNTIPILDDLISFEEIIIKEGLSKEAFEWAVPHFSVPSFIDNETKQLFLIRKTLQQSAYHKAVDLAKNWYRNAKAGWYRDY